MDFFPTIIHPEIIFLTGQFAENCGAMEWVDGLPNIWPTTFQQVIGLFATLTEIARSLDVYENL